MRAMSFESRRGLHCAIAGTLAAAMLALGSAAPAGAAVPSGTVPSTVVSYGDLNLATEAGVRALYLRIVGAARQICGAPDNRDLPEMRLSSNCRKEAIARGVQAVGNPLLVALHAAHGGHG
jgi:UrcA family protein